MFSSKKINPQEEEEEEDYDIETLLKKYEKLPSKIQTWGFRVLGTTAIYKVSEIIVLTSEMKYDLYDAIVGPLFEMFIICFFEFFIYNLFSMLMYYLLNKIKIAKKTWDEKYAHLYKTITEDTDE